MVDLCGIVCTHVARVVDEPRCVALEGGIDDEVVVDAEHVAAADAAPAARRLVPLLALVRQHRTDNFARVLYYHVTCKQYQIS